MIETHEHADDFKESVIAGARQLLAICAVQSFYGNSGLGEVMGAGVSCQELEREEVGKIMLARRIGKKTVITPSGVNFRYHPAPADLSQPQKRLPLAQRNAFRRRDVRQQSRSFARWNQSLRRSPNSNRLC